MIELQQPDGTIFIGKMWGDEFFWWAETEDGYRFVQSGDGWYYYAQLNQDGEFSPTNYKVGIDTPPAYSYQLERTQARIDEINQIRKEFDEQIELNRQWFAQKQAEAQGQPVTLKVGIILIEFQDVKHYRDTIPPIIRPDGYLTADFDSMMFSYNYWIDDPGNQKHPEGEEIFGSFRDYWDQMSRGKLRIEGRVVNPTDENGVPIWLTADTTREYYANLPRKIPHIYRLALEAIQKADSLGYISENPMDSNYYDKYAVVYAQEGIMAGALHIHAQSINGKYHFISERSGKEIYGAGKSITHIGIYAHEFGHTIGLFDEYYPFGDDGDTDLLNFCLMARGIFNGPDRKGACPATLSPYYRISIGWLPAKDHVKVIENDTTNLVVEYDYSSPMFYRINPVDAPGNMHYLLETRHREGFDLYIPAPPETFQEQSGTLIIWQHYIESTFEPCDSEPYTDRIRIKPADYQLNSSFESQLNDFFPFGDYQSLNDTTLPASSLGNRYDEFYSHQIVPAHFALNGIQKQIDGSTLIEEIILNHPLRILNCNSGGWQTVSVPGIPADYSVSTVFPTAYSNNVYKYQSSYIQVSTLENGPGYYAKFPSEPQKIILTGSPLEYVGVPVNNGWNITGSVSFKLPLTNVCTEPPAILTGNIYYYDGGYIIISEEDSIKPGIGYWIKTNNSGNLILDRNAEPCQLSKTTSLVQFDLSKMDKFIITDSEGNSQSLYVSNIDIDTVMAEMELELPPFFSELDFDSRFEYNEFVKRVSADSGVIDLNILVHTNSYPITLTWELNPENGISYSFINDSTTGKISNITGSGKASFTQLENNRIKLLAAANKQGYDYKLPREFYLEQNYPNPFNPSTIIKFATPKESQVNLSVFNILGERVKELKNEVLKPGYYEINFDASMLASGIYLYRIQAGEFVQTKKMTLIR